MVGSLKHRSGDKGQSKSKHFFVCQQCGKESPKWLGHCSDCGAWNSYAETEAITFRCSSNSYYTTGHKPQEPSQVTCNAFPRLDIGFTEINRVLGGGLVSGSLLLIGGEPGIGKSTLLLQTSSKFAMDNKPVAYISGEESSSQVKLRAERLNISGQGLYFLSETSLSDVLEYLDELLPSHLQDELLHLLHHHYHHQLLIHHLHIEGFLKLLNLMLSPHCMQVSKLLS